MNFTFIIAMATRGLTSRLQFTATFWTHSNKTKVGDIVLHTAARNYFWRLKHYLRTLNCKFEYKILAVCSALCAGGGGGGGGGR